MRVWGRILHCLYRYREIFILDRVSLSCCSFFLCPSSTFIFSYSSLFQYSPCFFHVIISNSPLRLSARTHVGTRKSTPWAGGLNEVQSPTRRWRRLVVGQQYQQFGVRSPPARPDEMQGSPANSHIINAWHTSSLRIEMESARRLAVSKKLHPYQRDAVETFLKVTIFSPLHSMVLSLIMNSKASPVAREAHIFVFMCKLGNKLDSILSTAPAFTVLSALLVCRLPHSMLRDTDSDSTSPYRRTSRHLRWQFFYRANSRFIKV